MGLEEADKMKGEDPCWDNYEMIGTKPGKDGRPVPNCVLKKPKKAKAKNEEVEIAEAKVGDTVSFHHELKSAPGSKVKKSGTVEKVDGDVVHVKVKDKYGVKRHQIKMGDLVKEETEQIDELNKDTVYSYNKKADADIEKKHKSLGQLMRRGDAAGANKAAHQINRRLAGMERAEKRLNTEEVEQIDEISAEVKQKYLAAATKKHLQQFLGRAPVRDKQELDKRRAAIQKTSKELTGKTHYQEEIERVVEGYKEPTDAAGHAKMASKIKKMLDDTLADRGDRHGNPDPQQLTHAYEYHMQKAKVDPKDLVVSLKDVPVKKPRGHTQYDPSKEFPGVKALKREETELGESTKLVAKHGDVEVHSLGGTSEGSATSVRKNGKEIATGDYDRYADAYFISHHSFGKGQKSFDSAMDVAKHFSSMKEGVEENFANDFLAMAKNRNPNARISTADQRKKEAEELAKKRAGLKPAQAAPSGNPRPLGGHDPKSGRSYSEEHELDELRNVTQDHLGSRMGSSGPGFNKTPAGKESEVKRKQEHLKDQIQSTKSQGGIAGPKGKLPEEVEIAEEAPPIQVRASYTQAYAKHHKTGKKPSEAVAAAYADVAKKHGYDMVQKLKAHHASNEQVETAAQVTKHFEKGQSTPSGVPKWVATDLKDMKKKKKVAEASDAELMGGAVSKPTASGNNPKLADKFMRAFRKMKSPANISCKTVGMISTCEDTEQEFNNMFTEAMKKKPEASSKQNLKKGEKLSGKQEPITISPEIEKKGVA